MRKSFQQFRFNPIGRAYSKKSKRLQCYGFQQFRFNPIGREKSLTHSITIILNVSNNSDLTQSVGYSLCSSHSNCIVSNNSDLTQSVGSRCLRYTWRGRSSFQQFRFNPIGRGVWKHIVDKSTIARFPTIPI